MNTNSRVQAVMGVVLAGLLSVSVMLSVVLSSMQSRYKLVYTTTATEGQPPQVALGVAMGAFRGIFVNMLWMRANDLKEAGRFHESVELANAITVLQPRFSRAWTFHAWNLAYNISVTTITREERWNWVRQGIALLRDEGLKYNPNDMHIHKELGWIFLHKVQGITDDANIYYKKMMAKEWTIVLGPPPVLEAGSRSRDGAIEKYTAWLKPMAESPSTLDALLSTENGPAVADLMEQLRPLIRDHERDFGYDFLGRIEVFKALKTSAFASSIRKVEFGEKAKAIEALLGDPARAGAWDALLAYSRGKLLREVYHMEPTQMIRYTRKYGPIDWRNPAAHALYWSAQGVERSIPRAEARTTKDYDFVNTDRVVMQAVQELYRTGTMYCDFMSLARTGDGYYLAVTQPHFVETYGGILEELRARSRVDNLWARGYSFYSAGFENFIKDTIRYFYRRGDMANAEKWRSFLLNWEGQNVNDPDRARNLSLPMDEFVVKELWDRQSSPSVAISEVAGALEGAYFSLRDGDTDMFTRQFSYARDFFRYFREKQIRTNSVNVADARMNVLGGRFEDAAGQLFRGVTTMWPVEEASSVYAAAPTELRMYAFDALRGRWQEVLDEDAKNGGQGFAKRFPEPPGMEAFRVKLAELDQQSRERAGNVDVQLK